MLDATLVFGRWPGTNGRVEHSEYEKGDSMNPILLEGGRILAPALVAAAKSIPASQLARFGLLRSPLVGMAPAAGAFLGGAAVMALLVPGSRAWMKDQALRAYGAVKEWSSANDAESSPPSSTKAQRGERQRVAIAE